MFHSALWGSRPPSWKHCSSWMKSHFYLVSAHPFRHLREDLTLQYRGFVCDHCATEEHSEEAWLVKQRFLRREVPHDVRLLLATAFAVVINFPETAFPFLGRVFQNGKMLKHISFRRCRMIQELPNEALPPDLFAVTRRISCKFEQKLKPNPCAVQNTFLATCKDAKPRTLISDLQ